MLNIANHHDSLATIFNNRVGILSSCSRRCLSFFFHRIENGVGAHRILCKNQRQNWLDIANEVTYGWIVLMIFCHLERTQQMCRFVCVHRICRNNFFCAFSSVHSCLLKCRLLFCAVFFLHVAILAMISCAFFGCFKIDYESIKLNYLSCRLSANRYTLQFDFAILCRDEKITLQNARRFRWHQYCYCGESRSNARLTWNIYFNQNIGKQVTKSDSGVYLVVRAQLGIDIVHRHLALLGKCLCAWGKSRKKETTNNPKRNAKSSFSSIVEIQIVHKKNPLHLSHT